MPPSLLLVAWGVIYDSQPHGYIHFTAIHIRVLKMSNPGILHLRICDEGGFDDIDFYSCPNNLKNSF
jgi:hypothetical protein